MTPELSRQLNAVGLLLISSILIAAFVDQFVFGSLPCPLCLLQRVGFLAVGFGLSLNILFGPRPRHYALMILAAFFGLMVSVRHILLHIVPGSETYGGLVLGLRLYTWAAIFFCLIILGSAIMLLFRRQYQDPTWDDVGPMPTELGKLALGVIVALGVVEAVSTLLLCGFWACPDNPTSYTLLSNLLPSH
ncbi:MAG: disulfide bond formation protein B [Pseudomonadota bacterium]